MAKNVSIYIKYNFLKLKLRDVLMFLFGCSTVVFFILYDKIGNKPIDGQTAQLYNFKIQHSRENKLLSRFIEDGIKCLAEILEDFDCNNARSRISSVLQSFLKRFNQYKCKHKEEVLFGFN